MKVTPVLLLTAAFLCSKATAQNTLDDYPNAPPGAALVIQADGTAVVTGHINYGEDLDVLSFQAGSNATLTVYTTGTVDTKGVLRRATSTGNTTLVTEDGGTGNFRISRAVEPGPYSIQVSGRLTAGGGNEYELHIEITPNTTPAGPPDIEVPDVPQGSAMSFGTIALNTLASKSLTLRNAGQSNLQINSVTVAGASGAVNTTLPFFIENGGARVLAPNATAIVQVKFKPVSAGNFTGSVRVNSNDPDENPYSFSVSGSGQAATPPVVAGEIAVSRGEADLPSGSEVSFGTIVIPSNAPVVRELIISNKGDTDLRLGAVNIMPLPTANLLPPAPAGFFRVLTPPAEIVAPGRSTVLRIGAGGDVSAAPQHYVMLAAIDNSDSDENPFRLLISADVQSAPPPGAPDINLLTGETPLPDEGSLAMGTTLTGTPLVKTLTIKNTGSAELKINGISILPSGPAVAIFPPLPLPFRVEEGGARIIAPGASSLARIVFNSAAPGSFEAFLNVSSNDPDENPFTVLLSAKAEGDSQPPAAPDIAVSLGDADVPPAGTVDFGRTSLTVPVKKTLTIANKGTGPLNVRVGFQPVTRLSNTLLFFRLSGEPFSSVPAGSSRPLSIVFQPMAPGTFDAILIISSNDPDENPYRLKLTGQGGTEPAALPDIGLSLGDAELAMNAAVDFGVADPGKSVTKEIKITNSGAGDLKLGRIGFLSTNAAGGNAAGLNAPPGDGLGEALQFRALPPPNGIVPAGRSAVLRVVYVAPLFGGQSVVLSIESNDPDESPWKLNLKGASSGTPPAAPEIGVVSGGVELPIGGTLDFGTVHAGTPVRREITISNTGSGELRISGFSIMPQEATANEGILFVPPPAIVRVVSGAGVIAPGASSGYVLEMMGFTSGKALLRARISNNDANENPYSFNLTGDIDASPAPGGDPATPLRP